MTDRIDLDEYATESEESDDADTANPGDWFWRGSGDPTTETATATAANGHDETTMAIETDTVDSTEMDTVDSTDTNTTIPRVPRENDNKPVGIPVEQGGAGSASMGENDESMTESTRENDESMTESTRPAASGPHGGGVDDMTLAFTYEAAKRLSNPQHAFADARRWADWIGIIGHTEAHVLNTFQRHNNIDLDFFNGTGTGPGERLAEINEQSMFFAKRMVVVGCDNETEIAETAGWEFVPLLKATTKADWELE